MFSGRPYHWDSTYLLNWEETGSGKSKMAAIMNLQLPVRSAVLAVVVLSLRTRKCGYKCSDHIAILYRNKFIILTTRFSGLSAAIWDFRLSLTSDNILLSTIELAILENIVGAYGILILSYLQAEIHALPV